MMPNRRTTFSKFIIEDQRRRTAPDRELTALLNDIQTACKFIASATSRGKLATPAPADGDAVAAVAGARDRRHWPTRSCCAKAKAADSSAAWCPPKVRSHTPHTAGVSARALPARVQRARRRGEPRHSTDRRHDIFGAARARRGDGSVGRRFSAAGHRASRGRFCAVRLDLHDRDHAWGGRARLHLGPRDRRLHADRSRHEDSPSSAASPSTRPISVSGSRRSESTSRNACKAARVRATRISTCAGPTRSPPKPIACWCEAESASFQPTRAIRRRRAAYACCTRPGRSP